MRHKLNTFIIKNPPEDKVSKAEKRCACRETARPLELAIMHCRDRVSEQLRCTCKIAACSYLMYSTARRGSRWETKVHV